MNKKSLWQKIKQENELHRTRYHSIIFEDNKIVVFRHISDEKILCYPKHYPLCFKEMQKAVWTSQVYISPWLNPSHNKYINKLTAKFSLEKTEIMADPIELPERVKSKIAENLL